MSMMMYGRMTPVRGIETPNRRGIETQRTRKPEPAVKEKMRVLWEFGVVNSENEESMEQEMWKLIKESHDTHFDRVLDGFARKLISEKLGG